MIIVTALNEGKKRTTWEVVSCNYLLLFTGSSRPGAVFGLLGQPVDALSGDPTAILASLPLRLLHNVSGGFVLNAIL